MNGSSNMDDKNANNRKHQKEINNALKTIEDAIEHMGESIGAMEIKMERNKEEVLKNLNDQRKRVENLESRIEAVEAKIDNFTRGNPPVNSTGPGDAFHSEPLQPSSISSVASSVDSTTVGDSRTLVSSIKNGSRFPKSGTSRSIIEHFLSPQSSPPLSRSSAICRSLSSGSGSIPPPSPFTSATSSASKQPPHQSTSPDYSRSEIWDDQEKSPAHGSSYCSIVTSRLFDAQKPPSETISREDRSLFTFQSNLNDSESYPNSQNSCLSKHSISQKAMTESDSNNMTSLLPHKSSNSSYEPRLSSSVDFNNSIPNNETEAAVLEQRCKLPTSSSNVSEQLQTNTPVNNISIHHSPNIPNKSSATSIHTNFLPAETQTGDGNQPVRFLTFSNPPSDIKFESISTRGLIQPSISFTTTIQLPTIPESESFYASQSFTLPQQETNISQSSQIPSMTESQLSGNHATLLSHKECPECVKNAEVSLERICSRASLNINNPFLTSSSYLLNPNSSTVLSSSDTSSHKRIFRKRRKTER